MAQRQKCARCSIYYQGFHVCLELPEEVMQKEVSTAPYQRGRTYPNRKSVEFSDTHRANLSASLKDRWDKVHRKNEARDLKIVEKYTAGEGPYRIAKQLGMNYKTVQNVLKRYEEKGLVKIRAHGNRKNMKYSFN